MQTFANSSNFQLFLAQCDAKQLVSIQRTIQMLIAEKLEQLNVNVGRTEEELFIPTQEEEAKSWGDLPVTPLVQIMKEQEQEKVLEVPLQNIEEDDFEEDDFEEDDFEEDEQELTQVEENKLNFQRKSDDTTDRTCVVVRNLFSNIFDMDAARKKIIPLISKIEGKKGRVQRLFLVGYNGDYSGTTFFYCYDKKQAARVFKFFGTCEDFRVDWRRK